MPSILAPPQILSALAFAVQPGRDNDLQPGTHLRIFAGLGPSFPVGPLVVRGFTVGGEPRPCSFFAQDSRGAPAGADFGQDRLLEVTLLLNEPDNFTTSSIAIDESTASIETAELLDHAGRVVGVRDRGPFEFSGPVLRKLRIRGTGRLNILQRLMPFAMAEELQADRGSVLTTLALPISGRFPWYLGIQKRDDGLERVKRGAPLRLNPMDRPFGSLEGLSPSDELDRVVAALGSLHVENDIDALIERLVSTREPAPWAQQERMQDMGAMPTGREQRADIGRLSTLQLAAADPGIARYLGFADRIDDLPGGRWSTLTIFGLFAVSLAGYGERGLDLSAIEGHTPTSHFVRVYAENLRAATGEDHQQAVAEAAERVLSAGLVIAPLAATLDPVSPWLAPVLPRPQVFEKHWQGIKGTEPSHLYRANFAFEDLPLVSQCGIARQEAVRWVSRNERLEHFDRAVPRIFGSEADPAQRLTELKATLSSLKPAGLLSDHDIDADAGPTDFAVWASDVFGRFPENVEPFTVEPPPRPKPPAPVLRFHFERSPGVIPAGASAGVVKVRIAVPKPLPESERFSPARIKQLGSAIVVPRLDDLRAGSFDIVALRLGIEELNDDPIDLRAPGIIDHQLQVPQVVDEVTRFALLGQYIDSEGNESEVASVTFEVRNFSAPVLLKTGVGLFWSSDPGPGPEVEVKLRWNAADGSRHRVYLADQAAMQITPGDLAGDPEGATSRGLVAVKGAGREGIKKYFRLLTDPPLVAQGGIATLSTRLPRSLETVQFLRVVPLGSDGEEADFGKCGIVAVAVPESRQPAPPRLDASVDAANGQVLLSVSTDAVDEITLERDEPGLFNPGQRGDRPPAATIRRAVAGVADPIYARQIGVPAAMSRDQDTGRYAASLVDDNKGRGLEPFVSYVYWAEWRMPPERRLPAEFDEVASEIVPVDSSGALDRPRPKSPPSAPRVVMHIPQAAQAAPDSAAVHVTKLPGAGPDTIGLHIQVDNPPRAHRLAAGRYRLAAWTKWAGGSIEPIRNADGLVLDGAWPSIEGGTVTTELPKPAGAPVQLTLMVAIVDPVDRLGGVTSIVIQ
ncbi:hypothetical protein [Mesorhizobium sp. M1E.F.Ca.ET.063.01.1.1]|uniref:hypothetical protein n=1 Tax=Mesorhizobium sp. M1E.F.Ca.ET.063.01.1.1 TaxID=2496750 RepID=UPI000FCAE351|nr:hypothetical protein [Mesorhizobium sp. M1E.F.Ca.ET.063.01.1.1]RUW83642.1 hypothetical protein EOA29_12530 [Mesorhizobium sp. M1E.F.Ca.ET.063.01.1.1]